MFFTSIIILLSLISILDDFKKEVAFLYNMYDLVSSTKLYRCFFKYGATYYNKYMFFILK